MIYSGCLLIGQHVVKYFQLGLYTHMWESYFPKGCLLGVLLHLVQQGSHYQLCVHTCNQH